jgi:type IV pilus assembly protein PilC
MSTYTMPTSNLSFGEKVLNVFNQDIRVFKRKLSDKKRERFYSELNILLTAGIDLKTAMEIVIEEQTNSQDKKTFSGIKDEIVRGKSLSKSIEDTGEFSPYEFYSIRVGEESGKLLDVLKDLGNFFAVKIKQKRQFINSISYPVIVLLAALGAIYFMLNFVIPMFADVFKTFKSELPALTKFIIKLSGLFSSYSFALILILLLLSLFLYFQRKKEWFRKHTSYIFLRIPVMGEIIKKVYLARFSNSMYLLMSSRTPLVTSLDLVKKMIQFYPIEQSLTVIEQNIVKGKSLHESMSEFRSIYDKKLVSLIKVAEEVNKLDIIFEKVSKNYSDEVEHQIHLIGVLLEPIIIIFLGLFVAIILIAMYLPLFQLSTAIGK